MQETWVPFHYFVAQRTTDHSFGFLGMTAWRAEKGCQKISLRARRTIGITSAYRCVHMMLCDLIGPGRLPEQ